MEIEKMQLCHFEPITIDTLKIFSSVFQNVDHFDLRYDETEVVFGTFETWVTDKMIATTPSFVHYVPAGRKLNQSSLELHPCTGILVRSLTKKVNFYEFSESTKRASRLLKVRYPRWSVFIKSGWNCLLLFEKKHPNQMIELGRDVTNTETRVLYKDLQIHKKVVEN